MFTEKNILSMQLVLHCFQLFIYVFGLRKIRKRKNAGFYWPYFPAFPMYDTVGQQKSVFLHILRSLIFFTMIGSANKFGPDIVWI